MSSSEKMLLYPEAGRKHRQGYNIIDVTVLIAGFAALPSACVVSSLKGNGQFKESEWAIAELFKGAFECRDIQYRAGRGSKRCHEREQ